MWPFSAKPKTLYKYMTLKRFDEFRVAPALWFAHRKDLDDQFDLSPVLPVDMNDERRFKVREVGCLSLAPRLDNPGLWALYSTCGGVEDPNKRRPNSGVVIGFDLTHRVWDELDAKLYRVRYSNRRLPFDDRRWVYTKSPEWAWQEEWRFILDRSSPAIAALKLGGDVDTSGYKVAIPHDLVTEVCHACHFPSPGWDAKVSEFAEACGAKQFRLYNRECTSRQFGWEISLL